MVRDGIRYSLKFKPQIEDLKHYAKKIKGKMLGA